MLWWFPIWIETGECFQRLGLGQSLADLPEEIIHSYIFVLNLKKLMHNCLLRMTLTASARLEHGWD